ncbi:hypothetical protein T484DRAFT_2956466 [Baffinella frigidus]|nr:hypothetical protein T484DRAFT_2956466 [Cryptophyta sp. CCMP2293]
MLVPETVREVVQRITGAVLAEWKELADEIMAARPIRLKYSAIRKHTVYTAWKRVLESHWEATERFVVMGEQLIIFPRFLAWKAFWQSTKDAVAENRRRLLLLTMFSALALIIEKKHRIAQLMESWMVSHENQEQQHEVELKEGMLREWAHVTSSRKGQRAMSREATAMQLLLSLKIWSNNTVWHPWKVLEKKGLSQAMVPDGGMHAHPHSIHARAGAGSAPGSMRPQLHGAAETGMHGLVAQGSASQLQGRWKPRSDWKQGGVARPSAEGVIDRQVEFASRHRRRGDGVESRLDSPPRSHRPLPHALQEDRYPANDEAVALSRGRKRGPGTFPPAI